MAQFQSVETDGDDGGFLRQCSSRGAHGVFAVEINGGNHHQQTALSPLRLGVIDRPQCPAHHRFEGDTALGMGLRIERGLGMNDVVFFAVQEIVPREVVVILLCLEDCRALVQEVEEAFGGLKTGNARSYLRTD